VTKSLEYKGGVSRKKEEKRLAQKKRKEGESFCTRKEGEGVLDPPPFLLSSKEERGREE